MDDSFYCVDEEQEVVDGISEGEELDDGYGLYFLFYLYIGLCDCEELIFFSCLNFGFVLFFILCVF